mgnify:CR=1 FL=1
MGDEFIFYRDEERDDFWHIGLNTLVKTSGDADTVAGGPMMLAAHSLNLGSIWIHRAKEEFELPEYQELLKELGVDGEWEGIGHCAVGYVDGEIPKAAKRKDDRVFWVD